MMRVCGINSLIRAACVNSNCQQPKVALNRTQPMSVYVCVCTSTELKIWI